ncbi:PhzF family phenazine biosynthesis protein [Nocardia rhamnosiphila]|uniref:PhzF family phenazine biosynthesis protein n=1 Tax=Nocardia rhamnosiphila TaxID=426716 RepID=UPI0033C2B856
MIEFEIVDVFSSRPFAGSRLCVVFKSDRLSESQMQDVARELNADETVFVLRPSCEGANYRVRVFTSRGESPFGSHSCIGTAVTLVRNGLIEPGRIVQECCGNYSSLFADETSGTLTVSGRIPPRRSVDVGLLCGLLRISESDAIGEGFRSGFGGGLNFLRVRRGTLGDCNPNVAAIESAGLKDVFVFEWDAAHRIARSRLFAPGYGIDEDPACASAAIGLGLWVCAEGGFEGTDIRPYRVEQGLEMGRPAVMECVVSRDNLDLVEVSVTGSVVCSATGMVAV